MPQADHPNVDTVRAMFAAFRSRDLAAILQTIPESLVWHFPGQRGELAGAHRGREAVLGFVARVLELTGGTFDLELEDVVGGDRNVIALFRGHATRGTKTLDNPTCLRVRFEHGKPAEIHEFVWDLYAVDDFWS
jgi:ketosteroid isomerase-like protein